MLLMLRLLATTLLLGSFVYANSSSEVIEDFLNDKFSENKKFKSIDVNVQDVVALKQLDGWSAYIVEVEARLKAKPKNLIKQKMIWFSNGSVITKDLIDMQSGDNFAEMVKPNFKEKYYTKENLIYGDENARHKVAIFSDPLCPFCRAYVPNAIRNMKKEPKKYAVYYYHFPLVRLHPASVTLVKASTVAQEQGVRDVILKLYNVKIDPHEKDDKKILLAFNKAVGTHITLKELESTLVKKQVQFDLDVVDDIMVGGTPTVYLDGKIDKTKQKYKKVK